MFVPQDEVRTFTSLSELISSLKDAPNRTMMLEDDLHVYRCTLNKHGNVYADILSTHEHEALERALNNGILKESL